MIDYTQVVVTIVAGIFSVVSIVFPLWLRSHMKDQTAATTISNAVANGMGAAQNAIDANLKSHPLQMTIPGISPATAAGVQYVLDNAGPELARFNITPAAVASKIEAKAGLANVPPPDAVITEPPTPAPVLAEPVSTAPEVAAVTPSGVRMPWGAKP